MKKRYSASLMAIMMTTATLPGFSAAEQIKLSKEALNDADQVEVLDGTYREEGNLTKNYVLPFSFAPASHPEASTPITELEGTDLVRMSGGVQSYIDGYHADDAVVKFSQADIPLQFFDMTSDTAPISDPVYNSTAHTYTYSLDKATPEEIEELSFRFTGVFDGVNSSGEYTSYDLQFDVLNAEVDPSDSASAINKMVLTYYPDDSTSMFVQFFGNGDYRVDTSWTLYESGTDNRAVNYKIASEASNLNSDESFGYISSNVDDVIVDSTYPELRYSAERGYDYFVSEIEKNVRVGAVADNSGLEMSLLMDTSNGTANEVGTNLDFWFINDPETYTLSATDKSTTRFTAPTSPSELLEFLDVSGVNKKTGILLDESDFTITYLDGYSYADPRDGVYTFEITANYGTRNEVTERVTMIVGTDEYSLEVTGGDTDIQIDGYKNYTLDEIAQIVNMKVTETVAGESQLTYTLDEKYIVDDGGYDPNLPGVYTMKFQAVGKRVGFENSTLVAVRVV